MRETFIAKFGDFLATQETTSFKISGVLVTLTTAHAGQFRVVVYRARSVHAETVTDSPDDAIRWLGLTLEDSRIADEFFDKAFENVTALCRRFCETHERESIVIDGIEFRIGEYQYDDSFASCAVVVRGKLRGFASFRTLGAPERESTYVSRFAALVRHEPSFVASYLKGLEK